MSRLRHAAAVLLLAAAAAAGCGKKGDPQPPIRIVPGAVADPHATRHEDRIELRVRPPQVNQDGSRPSVADRLEFYATTTPAAAPPPTAGALIDDRNLVLRYALEPPSRTAPTADPATPAAPVVYTDKLATPAAGAAAQDPPVRHYVVVAVIGGSRRGPPSPVISVPLAPTVPAPAAPTLTYDAAQITLTLPASADKTDAYLVDEVVARASGPAERRTLTPSPTTATFTVPVEFGAKRCFALRTVRTTKLVTLTGPTGPVACVTPEDTFGPAAPDTLLAIPGTGGIDLSWPPVDAADLAGYIVLRGVPSGGTLQALMTTPLAAASYRDSQVTPGTTYVYAVVAVDKAGNASPQSTPITVIAR